MPKKSSGRGGGGDARRGIVKVTANDISDEDTIRAASLIAMGTLRRFLECSLAPRVLKIACLYRLRSRHITSQMSDLHFSIEVEHGSQVLPLEFYKSFMSTK